MKKSIKYLFNIIDFDSHVYQKYVHLPTSWKFLSVMKKMSLGLNTVTNGLSWFQKVTDFLYVNIKMPLDVRFVTS